MSQPKGFKPMRMRWSYVLRMVYGRYGTASAKDLVSYAKANSDLFPDGMPLKDAKWVAHPEAFTDGEP